MAGKPQARVGPLKTLDDVAVELRRVYRMTRRGEIETGDLTKYANALQILAGIVRVSDTEKRLELLEEMVNERYKKLKK